jgi:hypothetical protein
MIFKVCGNNYKRYRKMEIKADKQISEKKTMDYGYLMDFHREGKHLTGTFDINTKMNVNLTFYQYEF